ncbi:MAG: SH3 domain-containing protein [Clostridia bacterium]|nr:SH3 domain-containing protein [Clostridia bacterium]
MKKTNLLTLIGLSAALAIGTTAIDGGIVDVDTRLNVRTSADSSAAVKTKLWDGQVITLHERSGNWWYVEYAPDAFGYVSSSYINELNLKQATVTTASTSLNVRESASTSAKIKDKLKKGDTVLILGTYGDFYKILYNGNLVGYASSAYLSSAAPNAITLTMPSYKQYNYPSLRLPGSGESVVTHGCAVTSLAMTESYRTGRSITPKTIIQNQKFTSSGAIYWPSQYSRGENSLEYIYNQLAASKPVIVHTKKYSGTTHFAVICGFSGGTLEAKNFKILDPGSASRKTLAQLYSEYPTLVKTISY